MPVHHPLAPGQLSYQPGDVIAGKYALEGLLGSGGMGAVFRARNTVIDMPVAIKLIRADLDRDQFSGRLLQEARAAAKLGHPGIVRVFDVGQTALGDPFIVMELLEGETLAEQLGREGRLTSTRAVQLLLPIADALSTAHAKGFVHRDVKPDNVFISRSPEGDLQPKLVDFGVVKEVDLGAEAHGPAGTVVGSPEYMSPEQARGASDIDLRSDVWSFCVVVYEAIVGRSPFEADDYDALMRLILESEPTSLQELRVADEALSSIIEKGLRKSPAERWPSLGRLGKALAVWLHDQGVGEDACGASLEARWLSRSSDPLAARVAPSEPPENWPEPPSGVRSVSHRFAPRAGSVGTPHSLAKTRAGSASRRRRWGLAAGIASAGAAVLVYAALRDRVSLHATAGLAPAVAVASASAPASSRPVASPRSEPIVLAPPPLAEGAAASALVTPPRPPPRPRVQKPRPSPALAPSAPSTAPLPAPPAGASDLLQPY
jgi:eukaryotic-like serine/threonine-protein kinase